jgi:Calcineurin-like phosphoesterase
VHTYYSPREGSSRAQAANEQDLPPGWYVQLRGARRARHVFKWLDLRSLWQSRNDTIARLHDPVNDMRRAWMEQLAPADPNLVIDRRAADGRCRVLVVGDPGEGDTSQWVLVPAILGLAADSDFMVVCSDVIYPTGDVNDYPEKFFRPYQRYGKPIYALPGNHDWYDQLQGFMFTFCDRLPPAGGMPPGDLHGLLRLLWRKPKPVAASTRERRAAFRGRPDPPQPAPYWVIDVGPLVLVGIDTGISGQLDRDQGDWLARVSREIDKPKVLLTGKPLIVDGQYHPGVIEQRGFTVDDLVREPAHRYVAAIGGDIHNYQRYPVRLEDGRRLEYVVAGGGGAFMHATHRIEPVDLGIVSEDGSDPDPVRGDGFRSFPLRGASLEFYARVVRRELRQLIWRAAIVGAAFAAAAGLLLVFRAPRWWAIEVAILLALPALASALALRYVASLHGFRIAFAHRGTTLDAQEAATWLAQRMGGQPTQGPSRKLTPAQEDLANLIWPRFRRTRGPLHAFFSEIFDIDDPPLYKQLLALEVEPEALTLSCYAAVGTEHEHDPPALEDQVRIPLAGG